MAARKGQGARASKGKMSAFWLAASAGWPWARCTRARLVPQVGQGRPVRVLNRQMVKSLSGHIMQNKAHATASP